MSDCATSSMGNLMSTLSIQESVQDSAPSEDWPYTFPLGDLPESCMEIGLSKLGPRNASQLACVSKLFASVVSSDNLWREFLPLGHEEILAEAETPPPAGATGRKLFKMFLEPKGILYGKGLKRCFIDKRTGGVCYAIAARAMHIVWMGDPRYWEWKPDDSAWFGVAAKLLDVCWFEVNGTLNCRLPPGRYSLAWRLRLARRYHIYEVSTFSVTIGSTGQQVQKKARLDQVLGADYEEFVVDNVVMGGEVEDEEIKFFLTTLEGGSWKSGVYIDCFMVYPAVE